MYRVTLNSVHMIIDLEQLDPLLCTLSHPDGYLCMDQWFRRCEANTNSINVTFDLPL